MSKVSVFDREWIDLVFEGRNKNYGAYKLRQQDGRHTAIALFSGIFFFGAAVGIPFVVGRFTSHTAAAATPVKLPPITNIDKIYEVPIAPKPEPETPKPQPVEQAAPAPSATPTTAFKPLIATPDPVPVDIPDMDLLRNTTPSSSTNPGNENGNVLSNGPGVEGGTNTNTTTTTQGTGTGTGTGIVVAPDEKPDFPGGLDKFRQIIANKFNTPDLGGQSLLKVTVSFVVEKDGSITNVKILKDPGHGAGQEAIRVLNSIKTKWKPGKVKGQPVRTAYTLPITLKIN